MNRFGSPESALQVLKTLPVIVELAKTEVFQDLLTKENKMFSKEELANIAHNAVLAYLEK